MKVILAEFALLTVIAVIDCRLMPRISFGSNAAKGAWPSQVLINTTGPIQLVCGGSIISNQWVLSAAHCIDKTDDLNNFRLNFGVLNKMKPDGTEVERRISEVVYHPQYETDNYTFDMALLRMDRPLNFAGGESHLKPMCLDLTGVDMSKADCYLTGFGRLGEGKDFATTLQQLKMKQFDHEKCQEIHHKFYSETEHQEEVTDLQFCMVSSAPGILWPSRGAACPGDSGGPLQCKIGNVWVQVGVTWSATDCDRNPSVFQWVYKYKDFIVSKSSYQTPAYCNSYNRHVRI